jgi:hypothetical protein
MMDDDGFEFEFLSVEDRLQLIADAARRLDAQATVLGRGPAAGSEEARIAREFASDTATLGCPVVYPVDLGRLDPERHAMPVEIKALADRATFYWLSFPVSLHSGLTRGFNRLEVKVEFNAGDDVRPTTFDVLPDQEWATRFTVGAKVEVGLTAGMKAHVAVPQALATAVGVPASASVDASANAHGDLVLGPFAYAVRVPNVTHTSVGNDHVFWRLDGAKFVEEDDPGLRVVLSVPKGVEQLRIDAILQATRYFNLLQAGLRDAIAALPEALASFFRRGVPIYDSKSWDLSEQL